MCCALRTQHVSRPLTSLSAALRSCTGRKGTIITSSTARATSFTARRAHCSMHRRLLMQRNSRHRSTPRQRRPSPVLVCSHSNPLGPPHHPPSRPSSAATSTTSKYNKPVPPLDQRHLALALARLPPPHRALPRPHLVRLRGVEGLAPGHLRGALRPAHRHARLPRIIATIMRMASFTSSPHGAR